MTALDGVMTDTDYRVCKKCGTAMNGTVAKEFSTRMRENPEYSLQYGCPICFAQVELMDYKTIYRSKSEFFSYFSKDEILWYKED